MVKKKVEEEKKKIGGSGLTIQCICGEFYELSDNEIKCPCGATITASCGNMTKEDQKRFLESLKKIKEVIINGKKIPLPSISEISKIKPDDLFPIIKDINEVMKERRKKSKSEDAARLLMDIEKEIDSILEPLPLHIRISIAGNVLNKANEQYRKLEMEKMNNVPVPRVMKDIFEMSQGRPPIEKATLLCLKCGAEVNPDGICPNCGKTNLSVGKPKK